VSESEEERVCVCVWIRERASTSKERLSVTAAVNLYLGIEN